MNDDLERDLERGPEAIKDALVSWRMATHERKKKEGLMYAEIKGRASLEGDKLSSTEIKHQINASEEMTPLILAEITAEAEYQRVYEKHLANKRKAGIRVAY